MNDQDKSDANFTNKDKMIPRGKKAVKKERINSMKNHNSTGRNGMHNTIKKIINPIPLSRDHQLQVGEPRGVITTSNPIGYSHYQRKQISSFQRIEMSNLKS